MKLYVPLMVLILLVDYPIAAQIHITNTVAPDGFAYTITKTADYRNGAIACAHPLASKAGANILKQGGNAFDAAIAVQLALAVVYPGAGNIGGGGFLVATLPNHSAFTLDYRETAPAAATQHMYINEKGEAQTALSQNGHLASGVPGTIAGLLSTLPYAKLPFSKLVEPAIMLAEKGFAITEKEAIKMNEKLEAFKRYNTKPNVFIKANWRAGDTLVQKDLANTLRRIRDNGLREFYTGETAKLIVAEMKRGKGMITMEDLLRYKVVKRKALVFMYRGNQIVTMPPPSSGGILLLQMLKMVEDKPLAQYGYHTIKSVQLMVEAERRAFADRATHLADPGFWPVPVSMLTSKKYLQQRMADYDSTTAGSSKKIVAGNIESTETTHISIIDKWGNAVSVTTTLNGTFGSKTVVGGAGFFLNNEMDDFSIKPGVANMYGAVGGQANAIAPNKRMLSSMTPTIVLQNKKPIMVLGSPGGTTIPTSVFQMIVNLVDFKLEPKQVINEPRFHHQWLPDEIVVEKGFSPQVKSKLEAMGYVVKPYMIAGYESSIGRVEIIRVINGKLQAVADGRGDDSVAGY